MAKRFTDSDKFRDVWYRKLSLKHKCLWEFILSECDHAGILEIDLESMSFLIGVKITMDDILFFGERILIFKENYIFIPKFIEFQYGILNENNKVHKSVLNILNRYKLFKGLASPLEAPCIGAKDKVKVKVKIKEQIKEEEKEEEKEEKEENPNKTQIKPTGFENETQIKGKEIKEKKYDPYTANEIDKIIAIYEINCPDLIKVGYERRNNELRKKISDFLTEIEEDFEYFKNVCIKANNLKTIVNNKINLKILINNHSAIKNDVYNNNEENVNPFEPKTGYNKFEALEERIRSGKKTNRCL